MGIADSLIYDTYIGLLRRHPSGAGEWATARSCQSEVELIKIVAGTEEYRSLRRRRSLCKDGVEVFIINCLQDVDRRSNASSQFAGSDFFSVEFIEGVDARVAGFAEEYRGLYDNRIQNLRTAACFLSHRKCWQKIVDEKLPAALIAEDDIACDDLVRGRESILDIDFDFDLIFFNHRAYRFRELAQITVEEGFVPVGEVYRRARTVLGALFDEQGHGGALPPVGGDGYLLSYAGAQKLLLHVSKAAVSFHVDLYLWFRCLMTGDIVGGQNVGFVRLMSKYHGHALDRLKGFIAPAPIIITNQRFPSVREP
jgi:glycosyl transferase family 25